MCIHGQMHMCVWAYFPSLCCSHLPSSPDPLTENGCYQFLRYSFRVSLCIYKQIRICVLKYILLIMLQLSHFFLPFIPLSPVSHLPPTFSPTPQFMYVGCTYNFFGLSTFYTIFNLPLSILCLPFILLIPCAFSHSSPSLLITLQVISISVILLLFQLFALFFVFVSFWFFQVQLLIVVSLLSFYCSYF